MQYRLWALLIFGFLTVAGPALAQMMGAGIGIGELRKTTAPGGGGGGGGGGGPFILLNGSGHILLNGGGGVLCNAC